MERENETIKIEPQITEENTKIGNASLDLAG